MKRILALLLAVLMLTPLFAACKKDKSKITLFKKGECKITYDSNTVDGNDIKTLTKAIENATGITPEIVTSVTEDCQIVIGQVDHPSVKAATQDIRRQDYVVGVYEGLLVIGAHSKELITPAIRYFTRELLSLVEDGELKLTSEDNYHYTGKYTTGPITVGGMSLTRHSIVIPTKYTQQELYYAYELYQNLSGLCGYELPIVTADKVTTEGQIRIGPSICEKATVPATHGYAIAANGNHLEIAASTALGYEGVRNYLFGTVVALDAKVENNLTDDSAWSGDYAGKAGTTMTPNGDVRIMLSNMYGGHQGQHVMAPRTEMLTELYLIYKPDVLGLQEYSKSANGTGFLKKLTDGGYRVVEQPSGAKTNGGQDATPLLYNPNTVELLDSGYVRFRNLTCNEYPELLGSYSAHAVWERCCNEGSKGFDWAIFRMKSTGKVFMAASVHLWWKGDDPRDPIGRKIEAQYMKDTLAAAAAAFADEKGIAAGTLPIFVGGDYNCNLGVGSPLHQMTVATETQGGDSSTFVNTNNIATNKLTVTTHHAYGTYETSLGVEGLLKEQPTIGVYHSPVYSPNTYNSAIDHIYMNAAGQGMVTVNRMGILSDYNAHLSSDHNPVYVDVSFQASCPVFTGTP